MTLPCARRRWRSAAAAAWLAVAACRSPATTDLPGLAERAPLPCSVLVTGGAFVEPAPASDDRPRSRTFADSGAEAIALADLGQVLRRGRVFVRAATDERDLQDRRQIAAATAPSQLAAVLAEARAAGHDYLLVLERVDDGPIEPLGVNGQWPITLATWLLVGLGAVIPDHAYEPRASLRASLRDVHEGTTVQEFVVGPGAVELSLLERNGFWGWMQSIVVPPFWVGDDAARVVEQIRPVVQQRLLVGLAQRLKSVDVADRLARTQPATVHVAWSGGGLAFEILAQEPISFLRLRLDDVVLAGPEFDAFHHDLLASRVPDGAAQRYRAALPLLTDGRRLQILVQTITGRVGSVSIDVYGLQGPRTPGGRTATNSVTSLRGLARHRSGA